MKWNGDDVEEWNGELEHQRKINADHVIIDSRFLSECTGNLPCNLEEIFNGLVDYYMTQISFIGYHDIYMTSTTSKKL